MAEVGQEGGEEVADVVVGAFEADEVAVGDGVEVGVADIGIAEALEADGGDEGVEKSRLAGVDGGFAEAVGEEERVVVVGEEGVEPLIGEVEAAVGVVGDGAEPSPCAAEGAGGGGAVAGLLVPPTETGTRVWKDGRE